MLFFCKHLSLLVNKQDQRTMKTAKVSMGAKWSWGQTGCEPIYSLLIMICKHNEAKIANVVYGQPQSEKF
jgi:hypothetical protein